jgi:cobalt-zinc-cadmium resistance protein CzcA
MSLEWQTARSRVTSLQENVRYYETQALPNTDIMQKSINDQLDKGEINYLQWFLLVNQVIGVRNEYLNAMNDYNRAIIQLDQFSNVN